MYKKTVLLLAIATLTAAVAFPSLALDVGQQAPEFKAKKTGGGELALSEFKGKWVVLFFYPKAGTPGCTKESCALRDGHKALKEAGAVVLGVSTDKVSSQDRFKEKYALPYTLIADDTKEVTKAFGVLAASRQWAKRKTFIIDPEGKIAHIFGSVNVTEHDSEVLSKLKELQAE